MNSTHKHWRATTATVMSLLGLGMSGWTAAQVDLEGVADAAAIVQGAQDDPDCASEAVTNQVVAEGARQLGAMSSKLFGKLGMNIPVPAAAPAAANPCAKADLIILDDWGLMPMTDEARRDILEILDDRHNRKSTIVTSQLPAEKWHDYIDEPTLAYAILDRLVHNAYRLPLSGESIRKTTARLTDQASSE